jgi:heterodisulfide reductase subunit C
MAIDIAAIMDALRSMAVKEGIKIAEPDILDFHKEVINSIERYGRTHKLEIMMRYKIRTRNWFQDMDIGLKMMAKRKLDLRPSRVKAIGEMAGIFVEENEGADHE